MSKNKRNQKYKIKITYSWGDEEPLYGQFFTKEAAFATACELAGREAYVQNDELDESKTAVIYVDPANFKVDLHYDGDDTWCYYRIEETA